MIDFLVRKYRQFLEFAKRPSLRLEDKRINTCDQEFEIVDTKGARNTVTWTSVCRINAFKRDLFSIDLICIEFYLDGQEFPIEVNERMEGYKFFIDILTSKFDGFDLNWYSKIVQPAFATNLTEIWRRKNQ